MADEISEKQVLEFLERFEKAQGTGNSTSSHRCSTATFRFHWSGVGDNGPFHIVGRGTSVLVRHDGALKLRVEHLSR